MRLLVQGRSEDQGGIEMMGLIVFLPKEAWGWLSVLIGIVAYLIYARKTLNEERVLPHPLSWFVWAFVTGVATVVQWERGAGAGAWVTALTTVSCVVIWLMALFKQQRQRKEHPPNGNHASSYDWMAFGLGMLAAILFGYAKNATAAAVLATIADLLGYTPTITKGWIRPRSDSATAFFLNSAKFWPVYFALDMRSIATFLYPLVLTIANLAVCAMLLGRRAVVPEK